MSNSNWHKASEANQEKSSLLSGDEAKKLINEVYGSIRKIIRDYVVSMQDDRLRPFLYCGGDVGRWVVGRVYSSRRESNAQPSDYESPALTFELLEG